MPGRRLWVASALLLLLVAGGVGVRAEDEYSDDYYSDDRETLIRAQGLHDEAIALATAGREREALPLFAQAAELDSDNSGFHSDLGVTQMRVGLLDAAKASFTKAEELKPGTQVVADNLRALQQHLDWRAGQERKEQASNADAEAKLADNAEL